MTVKLGVKPIVGDQKLIEVEPTDTELENYPAAQQMLIFQGKRSTNNRTVESYRIQNDCNFKNIF